MKEQNATMQMDLDVANKQLTLRNPTANRIDVQTQTCHETCNKRYIKFH
jgi:hypothetical protein